MGNIGYSLSEMQLMISVLVEAVLVQNAEQNANEKNTWGKRLNVHQTVKQNCLTMEIVPNIVTEYTSAEWSSKDYETMTDHVMVPL